MKNLYFFKLFIFAFILVTLSGKAQVITTFTPVYQTTQKGGIIFLANSSLGCAINPPLGATSCSNGVAQVPPTGTYQDNSFNSVYIDIDGDPTTYMSSSDSLNLPLCSNITKAYLFWGASGATTAGYTSLKMKVSGGTYTTVTAAYSQTNTTGFSTYHCYADVTNLVRGGGINTRVTVANMPSASLGNSNTFGSWNLVVVYNNDLLTMRQLTIFNGLASISNSTGASTVNIPFSGFLTPSTGSVTLELGVYVHDGDRSSTGDNLYFNGAGTFVQVIDAVNPNNDVMNSTVSRSGTLTPYRIPNMSNTAGLDADIYSPNNSSKNYIGNSVTSATFQMTTSSETYLPQMITTAIDVYEPDIRAAVRVRDVNGGLVLPGDILEYRVKGANIGSDPSVNTYITDTLDHNVDLIANSIKIVYGPNLGSKTDIAGDDQAEYNSTSRSIKVRIGTGANAATGGTVINSTAGTDSTAFTYSVMVTNNCVKINCDNIVDARAYIFGTGNVSGNTYDNGSNPGIFDINGCPIVGTTSSPITATACTVPTASTSPNPVCSGNSFTLSTVTNTDVTYAWVGPNSFTSALQNPVIASANSSVTGTYTVSLVAYAGCSQTVATTVSLNLCPITVADASNTAVNTAITGNVGTNDTNTSGGTFSITAQPSSGTVAISASTGQYTFTPATSFTGVTTATYQLCNGSPVVCSSASITFTVYPNIAGVTNTIITTPSLAANGNLITDDTGYSATAVYSVSVTQPSAASGTITINATTGQYTFTPNPAFSGTVSASYTVCNTSLHPVQCSNATISMVVAATPIAVNDAANTVINTTVTGNAGSNDTGVATGTFAINAQPATTSGTVSMNASTGAYTFTPTTGFTGTAQAVYQLCNASAAPCSTASITFTVYPNVSAVTNSIVTLPLTASTGSLLANDIGITAGASYSVSVTPLSILIGTLNFNSATGQYTFYPDPLFTGTATTSYTVCNISVNPQQCSNTTIFINVGNTANAVNDATTTVINTTVSGNASANDTGTLTGNYTITSQPSGGTVSVNSSTGVYTFTPTTGFTGTTSASYQLCNILSPPCSTASITFTVYPTLTAVANTIATTPSVAATGSLLANDIGITAGAVYSVSITQPSTSTGTIVISSTTGQYTFTPNSSFTGSASASYTVCNTSVNPRQCSNTTILINVGNTPSAVNDATTTVINTTVSGNAGANDSGVTTGTFSVVSPPASGTLTMNSTTGVYTFTPATGFTGTTSASYQLCNILSPPCSTASITFTIYPNVSAVANPIVTTPSVVTTGSLLANDIGIAAGAVYSVSVTQPATSTGTITINSTTGQYTFTPNPAFTGSASASYTVCNTSVNPQQCSSTSILLTVDNTASAVSDVNTTLINTAVTGSAAANDSGTLTGTFSIASASPNGTIAIDPVTGIYSFTPTTGFTGTTTALYQLCNALSPPCSIASINFTVYPTISAVANAISTTPSVATTGSLLANDIGITTGAVYSVSITQPSTSAGTITINASNGQYTFTPNPAFTGSASASYTVCNTSVNPQQCSNTTISISVGNNPVAVNDATNTVINTAVTGNAASNDSGVSTGTFSIVSPPASGTLAMTASTGIYTFTPASGFTGTVSASYQLCNVLSPPCSTASITFTIYPNVSAVSNSIITTPSVVTTGSLLTNDLGITAGANYSVSVTQPPTADGTITINAATGEYTFTPNPTFTGSASASYTVCNISVNPSQCSSTTLYINVGNTANAVNDATATVINTAVTGNAGANDSGVSTGTFTIVSPSANGTITINSATGVYSFTPTTGFTGTTSASYQLCNVLSPPCSTANIIFTVYPNLSAVANTISTTPSVTSTGSLLTNDIGITAGANYSVSVTQPPSADGTITINPATGEYTFIPNSSYTGSVAVSYTVCNTSVNPSQCSSTGINILVGNTPLAVNDATNSVINTAVTANAAANDAGATTGTFSVLSPPSSGTLTMNAATGVYTFTPASGFTGTVGATYQLCNVLSPPCSKASITFTIYPNVSAVSNSIATTPASATTGSLLANDIGITAGANYSVSITPVASASGTFVVNPSTGQYTFTPNPTFTGSLSSSYTVCNTSVNPQQCSSTSINITVNNVASAVNDGTNTIINTVVTGSAAANDSGVSTGSFSIVSPPATGSITIDPNTGVYSFTPAAGVTGTVSATYQLCNILSPPCSTATITFTIYPNVLAVANTVTTTPSVASTGSLLANDIGITAGANYSVNITQPPSTDGTITINPATGEYTFVPNPAFTGSFSTSYTLCNTSVNPQQCSGAGINIAVGDIPNAVNDGTNTILNTVVTGTAATNDTGVATGTFDIVSPSANGSIIIDPTTGVYSFTPATGFTGVTTATYELCNVLSPPCSSATINFTVFPMLTAVANTIATTPSVTSTGSLLVNDLGIAAGAIYSVSVTQPSGSTGTITLDPSTGNYTFTPNPSFTGTASASYTVCNVSVNPQNCSSTSITINVSNTAFAADDVSSTLINTSVTGNAATNDSGVLTATFSIVSPSANGSITINASTGVYSFTPSTGFTGTISTTYQLCNVLSPPCSTASITFTVYPNLSAADNTISTTPAVTATGSLLANDIGITPGAGYSVSITPPSTADGTLIINPATGEYTFTPDPAFTGSFTTSYTVCNTSVNPQQCSSATIFVSVGNMPVAVNDAATSLINTAVTGSAATNDSGVITATFSVVSPSINGTLTIDPATGVYTFVPTSGFTGTTSVVYQLCNVVSPPCSTASITFTIYPALTPSLDIVSVTPSVTTSGNLLTNDGGVTTGANYSVSITSLLPSEGTITIDPATGSYSFTPNPSFTGTTQTSYTVCNTSINPQQCGSATIVVNVVPAPLSVADATTTLINTAVIGSAATNDSGLFTGTFSIAGPSANGTITIDPNTGVYSFTPTLGFTGVATVTYQLCNALSVPCSSATISFTVYPMLVANGDNIPVIPATISTGSLLANDLGIVPGGNYSVTVSLLPSGDGTITVDPQTGAYSYTPDPAFTGSASITYTVCNNSVTPAVCSSATVDLLSGALAVSDFTTTITDLPVSGNASANDVSAVGGTYSLTGAPLSGTLTMNATGAYSYTPAAGFSGVATATYQLCDGTPQLCSNAVITITIFPAITAGPDVINITPSVTSTGTLTDNDPGAIETTTLGGTYSISVTALSPSTGTLIVDPGTGQYTFTPNPTFTGSATVGYTICNTSVNPQQCSSTTITINVITAPLAANDNFTTIANTTLIGNVTDNDSGVVTGTLSLVSPPLNGTLTIDPSSGKYTFIPATGFTGTVSAVYQLCNLASPPCSTAIVTFTVYPAVVSNTSTTFVNTAVTGDASTGNTPNTGLTYADLVNSVGASHGTMLVSSNGTYTFTPVTGFTGTAEYIISVCNNTINPPVCSMDTVYIHVLAGLIDDHVTVTNGSQTTGNILTNDPGAQTGSVTTTPANGPHHGTFTITAAGNFTYSANDPNYTGYDTVLVTVCIGSACSTNTIIVTVAPHLVSNTSTTFMNTPVVGNAAATNTPSTGLTYGTASVTGTSNGTMVISADGNYTFTPSPGFTGTTQYIVQACNTVAIPPVCANDTIKIMVMPGVSPDTFTVTLGGTVTGNILPQTGSNTVTPTPVSGPHHGTITVTSSGSFTYTSTDPDYSGYDTVIVTICDGPACVNTPIVIIIYPELGNDVGNIPAGGTSVTGNVLSNDHGTHLSADTRPAINPVNGSVTLNTDGTYSYIPNKNFCGLDSFAYRACDNNVPPLCKRAWVYLDVACDDGIFVPEGISPNEDGVNDELNVKGLSKYPDNKITIFNRWGNVVFEGNAETNRWAGKANKGVTIGGDDLPVGTYFYILDLKTKGEKNKKGYIYLQR